MKSSVPSAATCEYSFADNQQLALELAASIAQRLAVAVRERGHALIALSGGSSPKAMFAHLSRAAIPWQAITVTQVDERWVAPDHGDSNARLIREHLLINAAAVAKFVSLKNSARTPEAGAAECDTMLRALPLPFDVIVLGMGDDGHTASFFPGAEELSVVLDDSRTALCAALHPPNAAQARMTLTLRALQSARCLILQISGDAKLKVLRAARQPGPIEEMPVRAVLRQTAVQLEVWCSLNS